jgi:Sec-independent protein translocase protein TatA
MLSLSPAKLLVILVVALIVLGPDKLPQMARQLGAFWHDIRQWRGRIESEVRGTFPNLPPTHEVAKVVRSPLSFPDRLADEHEASLEADEADEADDGDDGDDGDGVDGAGTNGAGIGTPRGETAGNGAAGSGAASNGATTRAYTPDSGGATGVRSTPPGGFSPEAGGVMPDDPSMN